MSNDNEQQFSTVDKDNDHSSGSNCAAKYGNPWWQSKCSPVRLNNFQLNIVLFFIKVFSFRLF